MKTPPFLLGAGLLFWGWQTGFLAPAIAMAVLLEASRWVQARWDLGDEDFSRIWIFCTLLFFGAFIYAFTANEGPADFRGLFQNPNFFTHHNAGTASARTAAAIIRWLPMIFFFFIAAQVFSSREGIPLETISLILRLRWRRARKAGLPLPPTRTVNISYPYFILCLFAASARSREDSLFFWGLAALLAWALWSQRSRRFSIPIWIAALIVAVALGYGGQRGIGHLQRYFEGLNAQWLSGFSRHRGTDPTRSRTHIGQIGQVKTSSKIVIRLEPKGTSGPPPLLREASYRRYKAQTWEAGKLRNEFESIQKSTNEITWVLLPEKTNTACVNIACYLNRQKGLLPLASGSGRLEHLSAYLLYKNQTGAVLAEGPGLVIFDDLYGPGQTIDSPPDDEEDFSPPPAKDIAAFKQVLSELHLSGRKFDDKLKAVNQFFQGNFTYSMWQAQDHSSSTNETALSRFLLRTRTGHCEYFATATVLLLRMLEIPARYAVGYAVHEASGDKFVVRQRDAHAWCLVWNEDKQIWQDFDTTPASWVRTEGEQASTLQSLWDAWSRFGFELSKLRWGHARFRQYLLWSLAPVLALLLLQIIFRSRRRRQAEKNALLAGSLFPGLDSEFYQLEQRLIARGFRRHADEPLAGWLARTVAEPTLIPVRQPLQELLRLHYRYRFDPLGLSHPERQRLRRQAHECLSKLERQ
jgi:hypothetical protein